jgi:hypothetical protein
LVSDFKYTANNAADDAIDVATAPLHIGEAVPILTSPRFYLVMGGAGVLWGASYALDQTMKTHLLFQGQADLRRGTWPISLLGGKTAPGQRS